MISELPEGLAVAFGLPIAPGLAFAWPVVVPGGLVPWTEFDNPDALPIEFDNPDTLPAEEAPLDDAPADPPAPAACASPIEPANANALAKVIVANFMGHSLAVVPG